MQLDLPTYLKIWLHMWMLPKPIHGAISNFLSNYGLNDDGAFGALYDFKTIKLLLENGADVNSKKGKI